MNAILSLDLNLGTEAFSDAEGTVETSRVQKINEQTQSAMCSQEHIKHLDENRLKDLKQHQMHIKGARKCCRCAYNSGYQQGLLMQHFISLDIDSLGDASPNKEGNYKSVHQAFALGYSDGVNSFLRS